MNKELNFNTDARNKLKSGIDKLANAVKVTLGAKGRIVGIERQHQAPHMTKDGVSVAKTIFLKDRIENMGAQMVKGVAAKTADDAGDGTTTATVLAQAIVSEGLKNVVAGANPMDLKRGIELAVTRVVASLSNSSKEVTSNEQIRQVATISANNDPVIGALIADAMSKVGPQGTITVEESKSFETYVDTVEGVKFHRGYTSAGFVTNQETMEAVLDNPLIFMTPDKIEDVQTILPVLQSASESNRAILIVAGEISGEASATLAINKVKGGFKVAAIKAPFLTSKMKYTLEDLAVLTGGIVLSEDKGQRFDDFTSEMFGSCDKAVIDMESTIIMGGHGEQSDVDLRVSQLKSQANEADNKVDEEELLSRVSLMSGGVAVVYVGGNSEVEVNEKIDRVADALGATKAAVEEGIVLGGGVALLNAKSSLYGQFGDNQDQNTGVNIILKALEAPIRQIVSNAGGDGSVVINKIQSQEAGFGYDVKDDKYVSMIDAGIIDPAKVTRVALENAASVASLVLMTECTVTFNDDE